MKSDRIEQLHTFLRETPEDPFLHYALALEYVKKQSPKYDQKAREKFNYLLGSFPEYLPSYYHAALLFTTLGETQKAGETYLLGIDLARRQHAATALRELQNAYQLLLDDLE